MGVMGMIAKAKGKFHQRKMDVMQKRTDKIRQANIKEAELTKAKQELREAQQIKADLKADQLKKVEGQQPSKIQKMGRGLAKHMKKQKAKGKGMTFGAIPSTGSKGLDTAGKGSPFGGSRNLEVGGQGFQVGKPAPPKKVDKPKKIVVNIR